MESWRAVSSVFVTGGGPSHRLAVVVMAAFAATTSWGVHFATIPVSQVAEEVRELSAGIAHLIALPLGVASPWIARGARSAGR